MPVWGVYTLLLRKRPAELSPIGFQAVLVAFGWLPLPFLYGWQVVTRGGVVWSAGTVGTVLYIGIVASIVSFLLWNAAVPAVGANKAGLFTHLYPLFTAILAVFFLDEIPRAYHLAGVVLIGAGLYWVTVAPGPRSVAAVSSGRADGS